MERTRETITLDARTQQRLVALTHLVAGEPTVEEAATYLGSRCARSTA
jgi:hypothetical protein